MRQPTTFVPRGLRLRATLAIAFLGLCLFAASAAGGPGRPYAEFTVLPFSATPGRAVDASLDVSIATRSAAAARVVFYVPAGWRIDISPSVGTSPGVVDLSVLDDASPSSEAFVFGKLTVADPALGTDAIAQACAPGPHAAVWTGGFKVAGRPLGLRFYVDPTTAADASLGAYRLTTCFPSPYLPPEQGGAPAGMQVVEVSLLTTFTSPAAGTFTWRAFLTPFVYGEAVPDDASTFEARTRMLFPYLVTLRAAYQARGDMIVASGRVLALGKPRAGTKVVLFADRQGGPADALTFGEVGKTTKSRVDGTFVVREPRKRILAPGDSGTLEISPLVDAVHGPCSPPTVAPAGCVSDSLSPPMTPFPGVKIKIPVARGAR